MVNIGKKIKEYRLKAGKTQADLAHSIGCYPQTISYWENGRPVYTHELDSIANGLGVTVNELLELPGVVTVEVEMDLRKVSTNDLLQEIRRRTIR